MEFFEKIIFSLVLDIFRFTSIAEGICKTSVLLVYKKGDRKKLSEWADLVDGAPHPLPKHHGGVHGPELVVDGGPVCHG